MSKTNTAKSFEEVVHEARITPAWLESQGSEAVLEEICRVLRREYYRHSDFERAYGRASSVFRVSLIVERPDEPARPKGRPPGW